MCSEYFDDLRRAVRMLKLQIFSWRTYGMWVILILCSFAMVIAEEELSYPTLMLSTMSGVLLQVYLLMMMSDMVASSPHAKALILRASNRLTFLCDVLIYLVMAGANWLVTTRGFGHEPYPFVYLMLAVVSVIYRVSSIFMYRYRALSVVVSAGIGAFAALMILHPSDITDVIWPWIKPLPYVSEIETGLTIMVIGEIIYRAMAAAWWKKPLDRRVFESQMKRVRRATGH